MTIPTFQDDMSTPTALRDPALIKAASVLVGEGLDLSQLPDNVNKQEFLTLAELGLHNKLGSLQKARLEVLAQRMDELWERQQSRAEIEKRRAISASRTAKGTRVRYDS
jgi:hypothetical protein